MQKKPLKILEPRNMTLFKMFKHLHFNCFFSYGDLVPVTTGSHLRFFIASANLTHIKQFNQPRS